MRKGRLRFPLRPRLRYIQYIVCVLVSLLDSKKKKPLIDGAYRGRDIGDSEIDELSKLQGVEVVPNKDQP